MYYIFNQNLVYSLLVIISKKIGRKIAGHRYFDFIRLLYI